MRKLLIALLIVFIFTTNILIVNATVTPVFDTAETAAGVVAISYSSDVRLKVKVEKSGKSVTYDLKNDGTTEYYPLQFGEGSYKVSVYKNITGTTYQNVKSETINLDMDDAKKVYLASVQNITWDKDMKAIKKAGELTKGLKTDREKINAIYKYLISNITYDYDKLKTLESTYLPDIDNTIAKGKGICYDYSSTFAAMLRSLGIPAKLVKGYTPTVNGYHAWNEIYMSDTGKWITVDSTYDAQMRSAKRKYKMEKSEDQYKKVYEY